MTTDVTVVWDDGLTTHERTVTDLSEIVDLVEALDGRERTLVTVFRGAAHAAVGGSAQAGLVVYVTFDQQTFHQLTAGEPTADRSVHVTAGGQVGEYRAHLLLDVESAKAALREFVERGVLINDQRWEAS
jgi:hypothetical protein